MAGKDDSVDKAKDAIDFVTDLTSSTSGPPAGEVHKLEQTLADLQRRRAELKDPTPGDRDATEDYAEDARALDKAISEAQDRLAALHDDPLSVLESTASGIESSAAEAMARDRAEADQARADIAKATEAVSAGAVKAGRGDLEAAVHDTSGGAPDPMAVDNARASDDVIKKNGCTTPVLAGISIAVIIAVIAVILGVTGGDDSKKCSALGGAPGEQALGGADCEDSTPTTGATDGGAATGGTAGGETGALADYAGHYVLSSGLDDPTGVDTFSVDPKGYTVTVTPGSASFDIDDGGVVTDAAWHSSFTGVRTLDGATCQFKADGTGTASGQIAASDTGANGQVIWTLHFDSDTCGDGPDNDPGYDYGQPMQIGIIGDHVVMCRSNIEPDLKSCAAAYPRVVATFERE